jgi:hypothetical protein
MARQKSVGFLIFMIVLGVVVGSAVGKAIGLILPEGVVKEFFLNSVKWSLGTTSLDIVALTLTFGLSLEVNVMAVLGVIFAMYLYRWY